MLSKTRLVIIIIGILFIAFVTTFNYGGCGGGGGSSSGSSAPVRTFTVQTYNYTITTLTIEIQQTDSSWQYVPGGTILSGYLVPISISTNLSSVNLRAKNLSGTVVATKTVSGETTWDIGSAPNQVTSPVPSNGATNIPITQQLGWASASVATSYDVYFGTSSPGTFRGNQSGTTYNPGTLSYGTTYYWRIDSKNPIGTTTGQVWNFTTTWQITTLDSTGDVGGYTSIARDYNNKIHISYYDVTNGDLKYATNASGSWVYTTIYSTGDVGQYNSIALDSNNKVYISYYDASNEKLGRATNASGSWQSFSFTEVGIGKYTSTAIDSNNNILISYYDYTNNDLKYLTNASGSWLVYTPDSTGDVGAFTSIAVDSNNKVHISYVDITNIKLKYATNVSGSWVSAFISIFAGPSTSIAIDSNNKAHISYNGGSGGDLRLRYATNISGSWTDYALDSTGQMEDTSIAIDSYNKAHISYYDWSNGDLKYATNK